MARVALKYYSTSALSAELMLCSNFYLSNLVLKSNQLIKKLEIRAKNF